MTNHGEDSSKRVVARKFALPLAAALIYASGCTSDSAPGGDRAFVVAVSTDPGHLNTAITTNGGVHNAGGFCTTDFSPSTTV